MDGSKPCFIWMPAVNTTAISSVAKWIISAEKPESIQGRASTNCTGTKPSIIVIGPEPDYEGSDAKMGLLFWKDRLQDMADLFRKRSNLRVYWILLDSSEIHEASAVRPSAEIISDYNSVAVNVMSRVPFVTVFSGNRRVYELYANSLNNQRFRKTNSLTGAISNAQPRMLTDTRQWIVSLLAYVIENQFSDCCVMVKQLAPCQLRILNVYIVILITCVLCCVVKKLQFGSTWFSEIKILASKLYGLMLPATKFGFIIIYLYIERCTKVFDRVQLGHQYNWFVGYLAVLLLLGVVSVQYSNKVSFNNTDITQEWKGWMQLYIVVFHLFQGGKNFWIEVISRILVSHYLCLSGFGHFSYYWKRVVPDIEYTKILELKYDAVRNLVYILWLDLKRFMDVMFRLNFLLLIVCTAMNEQYMRHYFMPLIIVWFILTATCMTIFPRVNKATQYTASIILAAEGPNNKPEESPVPDYKILPGLTAAETLPQPYTDKIFSWNRHFYATAVTLTKCALLTVFVGWIAANKNVFYRIFLGGFQRRIFGWLSTYWRFRFSNDCYSVIYGLVFGLVYESILLYQPYIFYIYRKFTNGINTSYFAVRWPRCMKVIENGCSKSNNTFVFVPLGIIFLCISILIYSRCNHQNYDEVNKYNCIFPFLSYLFLRNILPGIRNHVSIFLVGVGKMSMEVYILHRYNGTTAFVTYMLAPDIVNLVLQTALLLCFADETHKLTGSMHAHLIPRKPKELLWKGPTLFFVWYYIVCGF